MSKPKKDLLHIVAYSEKADKHLDLYFVSIKEAAFHNPSLKNFREVGFAKGKK